METVYKLMIMAILLVPILLCKLLIQVDLIHILGKFIKMEHGDQQLVSQQMLKRMFLQKLVIIDYQVLLIV